MAVSLRYVAPAGSPVTTGDLARWSSAAFASTRASDRLEQALRERFGVRHVFLISTGRAGLTLMLRAMRRLAPATRDEVVLPSYTCYSVPASVVKAGLRPRLVDISPDTLDYVPDALERTDLSRTLAIVATNLFGLPNDLPALERLARQHGVFLVDDAAQAMGASVSGRWSGTWGEAGLFSLDKGKNVSAIDGGVIVTNSDDLAAALRAETGALTGPGLATSAIHVVKALAYFALLRPWLYGIPAHIPQLGLGRTVYTLDYPLALPDRVLIALGATMMGRLETFTAARQANAAAILGALEGAPDIVTIAPRADATPVYLRLPILVSGKRSQARVIEELNAAGIGATASYPASLADVPELQGALAGSAPVAEGGRDVARRIVTLPTHPFVHGADVRRMQTALERAFTS